MGLLFALAEPNGPQWQFSTNHCFFWDTLYTWVGTISLSQLPGTCCLMLVLYVFDTKSIEFKQKTHTRKIDVIKIQYLFQSISGHITDLHANNPHPGYQGCRLHHHLHHVHLKFHHCHHPHHWRDPWNYMYTVCPKKCAHSF